MSLLASRDLPPPSPVLVGVLVVVLIGAVPAASAIARPDPSPAVLDRWVRELSADGPEAGEAFLSLVEAGDAAVPHLIGRVGRRPDDDRPDPGARRAVLALAEIGDPAASAALTEVLGDRSASPELRRTAALGLGRVAPGDRGREMLLELVLDPSEEVELRAAAADGLAFAGPSLGSVRDLVREALEVEEPRVRARVVAAVGRVGGTAWSRPLVAVLRADPDPSCRREAARALGRLEDRLSLPALCRSLRGDEEAVVRRAAARALGSLGDARAIPFLRQAGADPARPVREAARRARVALGDRGR